MDCNHIVLLLNTVTVAIHRVCYCTTSHEVKQPHVWSDREKLIDSGTVTSRALKCSFTRATKLIGVRGRYLTVRRECPVNGTCTDRMSITLLAPALRFFAKIATVLRS